MPIPYEQTTVHTSDGFALALYRSRAPARPLRPRPPVLLIPGFSSNRFTFGVRQRDSLPALLNAAGRDVWLCELRGSQSSRWLGRGKPVVDVDAKLHLDLPAILDQVRRLADAEVVDVIGHSLGGLLALLAAGGDDHPTASAIGRIVTLATPGTFKGIVGMFESAGPVFRGLARGVEELAGRFASGLALAPLARTPGPLPHLFALSRHFLPGAVDVAIRRLYLDHAIEAVHGGELAQLTRWVREGVITDRAGRSLEDRFARVDVPVLVMSATRDRVAPEANTYAAYAKIASDDKQFRLVGRRHGARRDYAHADLLLADSAVEDVHEPIIDWLEARAERHAVRTLDRSAAARGSRGQARGDARPAAAQK